MKKILACSLSFLFLLLSLVSCSGGGETAPAPYLPAECVGMDYKELEDAFRSSGFANISLVPQDTFFSSLADKVIGIEIDIPGAGTYKDYNSANKFSLDSEIIITYNRYTDPGESEPPASIPAENPEPPETSEPDITYEFDVLQNCFISISENTTIDDILSYVEENSLFCTVKETTIDKTVHYKIAYTEGVARQSYADSGDCLEISFDMANNGTILHAQYENIRLYQRTALFYNYGTWYKFSNQNAEDYSGYYLVKTDVNSSFDAEGIVVKYNNGRETNTSYFLYSSPEEVIESILEELSHENT